jgi:hypothetical protein
VGRAWDGGRELKCHSLRFLLSLFVFSLLVVVDLTSGQTQLSVLVCTPKSFFFCWMNIVWKVWNFGGDLVYVIESLVFQAENFRNVLPLRFGGSMQRTEPWLVHIETKSALRCMVILATGVFNEMCHFLDFPFGFQQAL